MRFKEWINEIIKSGLLCSSYTDKVEEAKSKTRLLDIVLDANGSSWLPEMDSKGMPLPYETILREFKPYINGKYVGRYYKHGGKIVYTSSIYCCFSDSSNINIETTLTTILGCKSNIMVKENDFVKLYVDKNCEITINCPLSSRCIVEYWKGAKIEVNGNYDRVELIEN